MLLPYPSRGTPRRWPACACIACVIALSWALAGCGDVAASGPSAPISKQGELCLCGEGGADKTLWCPVCDKGWVQGVATQDKAAVDKALAEMVRVEAERKGVVNARTDEILADIAAGLVKKPKCSCEACQDGRPEDHQDEADDTPAAESEAKAE